MAHKVAIVLRAGSDAGFLLKCFDESNFEPDLVILEKPNSARWNKFSRELRRAKNPAKFLMLDLPSLILFDFFQQCLMNSRVVGRYTVGIKTTQVTNINDDDLLLLIEASKPDYIFNFGTSLYLPATLEKISIPIFNWHTGILPRFRNVHTDFWAYMKNEPEGLGVTVFEIDEGIDTGRIVWVKKSFVDPSEYLWMIKRRNLEFVATSMINFGLNPSFLESDLFVKSNGGYLMCQTPDSQNLLRFLFLELGKWGNNILHKQPFKG